MKLTNQPSQDAAALLRVLEKKIIGGQVDASLLAVVQRKLDAIEPGSAGYEDQYPVMVEVQALLHLQGGDRPEAKKFLREAVRLQGGVKRLKSHILQQYIEQRNLKLGGTDLSKLDDKQRAYLQAYDIDENTDIRFFTRAGWQFLLLSLVTLGLYELVWLYKNWKAIKQATGHNLSPFWRAFWSIIWVWPLFRIIRYVTQARGVTRSYNPGAMATLYIAVSLISTVALNKVEGDSPWYWVGTLISGVLTVMVLVHVQRSIEEMNAKQKLGYSGYTKGEIVFSIVSAFLFAFIFFISFATTWLKIQDDAGINSAKSSMDSLTTRYDDCSSELNRQYSMLDQNDQYAVNAYNRQYDVCEEIRLQQNKAVDDYNELVDSI